MVEYFVFNDHPKLVFCLFLVNSSAWQAGESASWYCSCCWHSLRKAWRVVSFDYFQVTPSSPSKHPCLKDSILFGFCVGTLTTRRNMKYHFGRLQYFNTNTCSFPYFLFGFEIFPYSTKFSTITNSQITRVRLTNALKEMNIKYL